MTSTTNTTPDHLPTPWKVDPRDPREIIAEDGTTTPWNVAQMHEHCGGLGHRDRSVANAAFIVRAVNSHAALVEACESMRERLTELANASDQCWRDWPGAYAVESALALAEGGAA